ncbi:hypothetical protein ACFVG1_02425, partial [Streptomyces bacillaris]|uniref:hypothetical protein n=1 Tax=Streptomyces bacillaris TaxID=68179 RepID=UPI003638323B
MAKVSGGVRGGAPVPYAYGKGPHAYEKGLGRVVRPSPWPGPATGREDSAPGTREGPVTGVT